MNVKQQITNLLSQLTDNEFSFDISKNQTWKATNQLHILKNSLEIINERKLHLKKISPSFLYLFLDSCKYISDPNHQLVWSHLFINAVDYQNTCKIHDYYCRILSQLPISALAILKKLYELSVQEASHPTLSFKEEYVIQIGKQQANLSFSDSTAMIALLKSQQLIEQKNIILEKRDLEELQHSNKIYLEPSKLIELSPLAFSFLPEIFWVSSQHTV
ncbi:Abi-alpha family protein [Sediminitomix flava]|uniref:Uncharacterized protein n=1 Tax=Sediminitomix flava TaxID=379075 RepID=A0A315Z9P2_SEDFL|nr:hypothetical protein [Sediminitomix flava]PWJ42286.1 hypothetical protein BC781_103538 [Sediminitomix flava]